MPEILAYEEATRAEVEARLGPRRRLVNPIVGTVFPNFSMLRATSRTFRVWQPRGPDKTEVWSWLYVDRAAPPQVKEAFRLAGVRGFSPSGTFEQDDMDNWQECTRTSRGVVSRRAVLNTQMGLGHERFDERPQRLGQRLPDEREQPPPVLSAMGGADGGRELGRGTPCVTTSFATWSSSCIGKPGCWTSGASTSGSSSSPTTSATG